MKFWDTETGREVTRTSRTTREVQTGDIKVWDTETGKETLTLRRVNHSCACFSPDGKQIATGGPRQTVKVWDAVTGHEVLTLKGDAKSILDAIGSVWCVSFSPDGKRIVTANTDGTIKVWNVPPLPTAK